jgi:lipopolysaccharide transport system ATP-binding protein
MSSIISVENLGKKYRIHHQQQERYTSLRDVIARKAGTLFQKLKIGKAEKLKSDSQNLSASQHLSVSAFQNVSASQPFSIPASQSVSAFPGGSATEDFWAIKDVSFEVKQGEVVGIIGRNGAGKSTLLKILSRITEPTEGRVTLRGRVASLLEVGTGFHPELTGRENIFLNGAILGMSQAEIRSKFDEIVAFAEVEKFLDTPVKRYSSGMYVRLAFAVAAHLEPEILIIDEVLAVGDVQFQKKCLGKMEDVAKKEGRTVLFVSHNMDAITRLCSSALLIDRGGIASRGAVTSVVGMLLAESGSFVTTKSNNVPACGPFRLHAVRIRNQNGIETAQILWQEYFSVEVEYEVLGRASNCMVWVAIRDAHNQVVICTADCDASPELRQRRPEGRFSAMVQLPGALLNAGYYTVVVGSQKMEPLESYFRTQDITLVVMHESRVGMEEFEARSGAIKPILKWSTDRR